MSHPLENARKDIGFNPDELKLLLRGGHHRYTRYSLLVNALEERIKHYVDWNADLDHPAQYLVAMKITRDILDIAKEYKVTPEEFGILLSESNFSLPIALHFAAFLPVIETQTSEQQKLQWVEKTRNLSIIGCYAQTELSHGSNFRELQTTATYIRSSEEFELNTPTVEATKWWCGGLGRTATHAIVHARLLIPKSNLLQSNNLNSYAKNEVDDFGVHPFIVQIRDLKTHQPLQGITVGDIGAKMGYNSVDNGYMILKGVRIPRDRLLGRTGYVSKDGNYQAPNKDDSKASYSSMTHIRVLLVRQAGFILSKATTIAVRYLETRQQFSTISSKQELHVLDYNAVQYRVLPIVATTFAMIFTGEYMDRRYNMLLQEGFKGGELLKDIHATSSGLKGLCTSLTSDGSEILRRACGGHGYLSASGLSRIVTDNVSRCTAEGDNYLLSMLTTKFLLKSFQSAKNGGSLKGSSVEYIENHFHNSSKKNCNVKSVYDWNDPNVQKWAFEIRTMGLLKRVCRRLETAMGDGKNLDEVFNDNGWDMIRVSHAHCQYILHCSFNNYLNENKISKELSRVLHSLSNLYSLYTLEENCGDLLLSGYVNDVQMEMLHQQILTLLQDVRTFVVPLMDSFEYSDTSLGSAIGMYNANPYEQLLHSAQNSKLNQAHLDQACYDSIQQIKNSMIKSNL